jgi:hypothetical protein
MILASTTICINFVDILEIKDESIVDKLMLNQGFFRTSLEPNILASLPRRMPNIAYFVSLEDEVLKTESKNLRRQ